MANPLQLFCERVLRVPPDPKVPPGDEASTRIFRAARNYYRYLLALWALKSILLAITVIPFALVTLATGIDQLRKGGASGFLLLLLSGCILLAGVILRILALAVVHLDYEKRWYLVTDRSLRVREGVIRVNELTVTFANIQNISISQGPIQRALGIADLRVDTAGGGVSRETAASAAGHTAWFRGIDNADEIRRLIRERLHKLKDSGLGDHEEPSVRTPAPSPDLLIALRAVHSEAELLRRCMETRSSGAPHPS
jgi:uncharacterized membrane protein YdbT with pleckstrin-like domain